ncbi:MAG: peptidase M23 [Betaproteobacteria bacterium RIFCSPLOWO2_02_FULL_62_17]|nr:MAG: peptidase M23 [Betaproteobacteria bacterium RIFCSPLOWO2_02_FULL_62_17]
MHIILVPSRLAAARSVTLGPGHLALAGFVAMTGVLLIAVALFYLSLRYSVEFKLPLLESALATVQEREARKAESFLRENLNAMAVKLGQMQAQLMRLDALGDRVSSLAGLKPSEFRFNEIPGRGGATSTSMPSQDLSMADFGRQLDMLSRQMDNRTDSLGILETTLFDVRVKKRLLPTVTPVDASWNASSFGWRIDPFTGQNALHEGVDFISDAGTPIFAAAGGVVLAAEVHHQYGRMIEIDHGNDFVTRYAHASKLLVKPGDVVQRGRKIAEVGSTGRSTGPHLHFEVRYRGVAQNPARFLQASAR